MCTRLDLHAVSIMNVYFAEREMHAWNAIHITETAASTHTGTELDSFNTTTVIVLD